VVAGVGALVLLGAAWLATNRDDGRPPEQAPATSTTRPAASATTQTMSTSTSGARRANTEWGGLNLTDVTSAAGLDEPQSAGPPVNADVHTGGAAVADYDDDGDQDVLLTRVGLPNRLLRNDGAGTFTDVAERAGVAGPDPDNGYAAGVWADVDGDGDLDLYLTGAGRGGAALLVNDGSGRFEDHTEAAGLDGLAGTGPTGTASYGAAFDDWDHDGDLDLVTLQWYITPLGLQLQTQVTAGADASVLDPCTLAEQRRTEPVDDRLPGSTSRLLENDGNGTFTDVTASSGVDVDQIIGFQPVFADADGDGWDDLFVTGDYCTSRLYRNQQGQGFTDVTDQAGVGTDGNGMGSVVADLDGDGNLDWFVSSIQTPEGEPCGVEAPCGDGNRLYLGDGSGHFTDGTDRFGVRDGSWGWGAAAADFNQDGRVDLALATGMAASDASAGTSVGLQASAVYDDDATRVWVNTGDGPWPEVAERIGVRDRADGKAMVAFDADGDGDVDLLAANTEGAPVLYRNDTAPGADNHWITLRLRAPGTKNPFGIGARVLVDVGDGRPPRPLEVRAGGSFQSADPTDLHVGLGSANRVERIEVQWPGDSTPQVLTDVEADQVVAVTRR